VGVKLTFQLLLLALRQCPKYIIDPNKLISAWGTIGISGGSCQDKPTFRAVRDKFNQLKRQAGKVEAVIGSGGSASTPNSGEARRKITTANSTFITPTKCKTTTAKDLTTPKPICHLLDHSLCTHAPFSPAQNIENDGEDDDDDSFLTSGTTNTFDDTIDPRALSTTTSPSFYPTTPNKAQDAIRAIQASITPRQALLTTPKSSSRRRKRVRLPRPRDPVDLDPENFPQPPPHTVKLMRTPSKPKIKKEDTMETDISLGGSTAVNSFSDSFSTALESQNEPSSDGKNSVNSLLTTISDPETSSAAKAKEKEPKTPSKPPKEGKGVDEGDKLIDKLLKSVKKGEKAADKAAKAQEKAAKAEAKANAKATTTPLSGRKRKATDFDSEASMSSHSDTEDDDNEDGFDQETPSKKPIQVNEADTTPRKSLPRRSKSITPSSAYMVDEEENEEEASPTGVADDSPTPVRAVSVTVQVPTTNPEAADATPPATATAASNEYITVPATPTALPNTNASTSTNNPHPSPEQKLIDARAASLARKATKEEMHTILSGMNAEYKAELTAKGIQPLIHHFKVKARGELEKEGRVDDWVIAAIASGPGDDISGRKALGLSVRKDGVGTGSAPASGSGSAMMRSAPASIVGAPAKVNGDKTPGTKKAFPRLPYAGHNSDDDSDYGAGDEDEDWFGKSGKKKAEKKIGWRERVEMAKKMKI
jgi:hypothetical protein